MGGSQTPKARGNELSGTKPSLKHWVRSAPETPFHGKRDLGRGAEKQPWGWLGHLCRSRSHQDRVTPISLSVSREDVETRNSAFLFWPLKEADTQDSGEPRAEKPRGKKRPAKQPPLQQAAPSDSDGSSHGTSSHGSRPGTHPEPEVWVMGGNTTWLIPGTP